MKELLLSKLCEFAVFVIRILSFYYFVTLVIFMQFGVAGNDIFIQFFGVSGNDILIYSSLILSGGLYLFSYILAAVFDYVLERVFAGIGSSGEVSQADGLQAGRPS